MNEKLLSKIISISTFERVSEENRLKMRSIILEDMNRNGFHKYRQELNRYTSTISEKLRSSEVLMSDSPPFGNNTFWDNAIPELKKFIPRGIGNSATAFMSSKIIGVGIDAIVGDSPSMTIQQKIMFKSLLSTYFSDSYKMFPVSTNMDSVLFAKVLPKEADSINDPDSVTGPKKVNAKVDLKRMFTSALSGSGPFMLKILQSVSTKNDKKIGKIKVSEITKSVFSNVPPMTTEETNFVIRNLGLPERFDISRDVLGSASIAQAHYMYLQKQGKTKSYVIKMIKPMYAFYFLCELDFILTETWKRIPIYAREAVDREYEGDNGRYEIVLKQCRQLLLFFCREFAYEFDYKNEFKQTVIGKDRYRKAARQELGKGMYRKATRQELGKFGVRVAGAISYGDNPFPYLVLQRVPGNTLDALINDPKKGKGVPWNVIHNKLLSFLKKWFESALMEEPGFFHADAHPGNILWDGTDLVLIDFGSTGSLTRKEQCALLKAMNYSGKLKWVNPNRVGKDVDHIRLKNRFYTMKFIRAIWNVCNVRGGQEAEIEYMIDKVLNYKGHMWGGHSDDKQTFDFGYMFIDTVKYSRDIGTCVSSSILLYGRAISYIVNSIKSVQSKCKTCPTLDVSTFITWMFVANFAKVKLSCDGIYLFKDEYNSDDIQKAQQKLQRLEE